MSGRRLLLDAGNTRLKWAIVEGTRWLAHGHAAYDALGKLDLPLEPGMPCHVASVARRAHDTALAAWLSPHAIDPRWLVATAAFGDVTNAYDDPKQLGVDRWMALIAARQRTRSPALVVSVGTAMTVDALAGDGRFLGGIIVPGLTLMRHALDAGTARLRAATSAGQHPDAACATIPTWPMNTADAIDRGLVVALCGAIRAQHAALTEATGREAHCYLTGGDADCIAVHLGLPVEPIATLVLEGIERVTRECETI